MAQYNSYPLSCPRPSYIGNDGSTATATPISPISRTASIASVPHSAWTPSETGSIRHGLATQCNLQRGRSYQYRPRSSNGTQLTALNTLSASRGANSPPSSGGSSTPEIARHVWTGTEATRRHTVEGEVWGAHIPGFSHEDLRSLQIEETPQLGPEESPTGLKCYQLTDEPSTSEPKVLIRPPQKPKLALSKSRSSSLRATSSPLSPRERLTPTERPLSLNHARRSMPLFEAAGPRFSGPNGAAFTANCIPESASSEDLPALLKPTSQQSSSLHTGSDSNFCDDSKVEQQSNAKVSRWSSFMQPKPLDLSDPEKRAAAGPGKTDHKRRWLVALLILLVIAAIAGIAVGDTFASRARHPG